MDSGSIKSKKKIKKNIDEFIDETEEIITNPKRWDGFGSQFQMIIVSSIYAELNNKKFVYTPFQAMEHNYNDDPDYIARKEWLINFIDNFEINKNNSIPQKIGHGYVNFFESNLDKAVNSETLKKIKKVFRANKNINNYFNNKNLNIAIHIRRHNSHDNRIDGTDIPDALFLNIISKLRTIYSSKNPLFHIYSQGDEENFKKFIFQDTILHLNEPLEDSFTGMVLADVLVTSPSAFSYTAGILSEGVVYCIPFWLFIPLPHWIIID